MAAINGCVAGVEGQQSCRKQTISPLHRRSLQIGPDKIGTSFADHHRRCIGVARNQPWHDAGVGDVQPVQPSIFKVRIDDGIGVGPHPAGADRVIYGVGATADQGIKRFIARLLHRVEIDVVFVVGSGLFVTCPPEK